MYNTEFVKSLLYNLQTSCYYPIKRSFGKTVCYECHPDAPYQFKYDDIQMDKQFLECPVITAEEYDKCYFLVHRAYAYFFGDFNLNIHLFGEYN